MRKSLGEVMNVIFGWGIYACLFAGGLAAFGFIFALIIGGQSGEAFSVFLQRQYFPVVIRVASFIILFGLIGMYVNKQQALSIVTDKKEADRDIEESRRMEARKK